MNYKKIQASFFIGLLILSIALVVGIFLPYIYPLIFAIVLVAIVHPLYARLLKHPTLKNWPSLSAFIIVILTTLVILIPLTVVISLLAQEATTLYTKTVNNPATFQFISGAQNYLVEKFGNLPIDIGATIKGYTANLLGFVVNNIGTMFTNIVNIFLGLFVTLFALYYLLKDGTKIHQKIIYLSPLSDRNDQQIFDKLTTSVNSVIKGTILIAIMQGVLEGIGLFVFGVPNPVLLGTITVIGALIPMLGTVIITIPATIYLFATGHFVAATGFLLWGLLIVGLVDNFVRPKVLERETKLHPLLLLLSVLGGINFFGALGFILGPILLSLLFTLLEMYKKDFKKYISKS